MQAKPMRMYINARFKLSDGVSSYAGLDNAPVLPTLRDQEESSGVEAIGHNRNLLEGDGM